MFSSLSTLTSSTSSSSANSANTEALSADQGQDLEEEIPLTSQEEVERKLASTLTQVQQDQIKHLDLTSSSLGRFYELANTLNGHQSWIASLVVLKNGGLASGSGYPENAIKLWDLPSRSCLSTLRGHTEPVETLAVLPNGLLVSGSWDKTIKLWDLVSNTCLSTLQGHTNSVNTLTILPNSRLASGSSDTTIKLWDLASHSCFSTLLGHTRGVQALAILPNGQLASGSEDSTIKLWDLASNSCLSTLQGHTWGVYALAVLPNKLLVSGSDDITIKLWDLSSHSCLASLQGHTNLIYTLTALPNGLLANGSSDGTIKLWEPKTLSAKYLSPILNALKSNTSVTDFDLSGNQDILDDFIDPLVSIFTQDASFGSKPNATLRIINLQRTGVSRKGVRKLKRVIHCQRLTIEVLFDCPAEWMMIYFLIIFCRANRNSPFADSGLELCKHDEIGPFLGIPSGFFARPRKSFSSKSIVLSSSSPS